MKATSIAAIAIAVSSCTGVAGASSGTIVDRVFLEEILGDSAVTEDFESIEVPDTGGVSGLVQFNDGLSSLTVGMGDAAGLGPGLVVPGITFKAVSQTQIVTPALAGSSSQLLSWSSGSFFTFEFDRPARAVGFDMFAIFGNVGDPDIEVFDASGNRIARIDYGTVDSPTVPRFFGYENQAGISEVRVTTFLGGPLFDDVTFGLLIPEPSTFVLAAIALGPLTRPRRKVER